MVRDTDNLQPFIDDWDEMVEKFREAMGSIMEKTIKEQVFDLGGPATQDSDPLNPRGQNPKWEELSGLTIQLKGSSAILINTHGLFNAIRWQIEDSDYDNVTQVVKLGWFEDSGDLPYIACIHEFGLTGATFLTPDGNIEGGEPIGRTSQARAGVRSWFYRKFGMHVTGRVVIPERSMLRKTADMIDPNLEAFFEEALNNYLKEITIR